MLENVIFLIFILGLVCLLYLEFKKSILAKLSKYMEIFFGKIGKRLFDSIDDENDLKRKKHNTSIESNSIIFYKWTKLYSIVGITVGGVLLILGEDFLEKLDNFGPLNWIQILGLILILAGLCFYAFFNARVMFEKENIPAFASWMFCMLILVAEISLIIGIRQDVFSKDGTILPFIIGLITLMTICVIIVSMIRFVEFLIIKINTFFTNSTERLSIILGFFGTIITLIVKIIN